MISPAIQLMPSINRPAFGSAQISAPPQEAFHADAQRLELLLSNLASARSSKKRESLVAQGKEHLDGLKNHHDLLHTAFTKLQHTYSVLKRLLKSMMERYQVLKKAFSRDALTGLYNRQFFDVQLKKEMQPTGNHNQSKKLSLLMIDLDKFKLVNDKYGHVTGDMVLKTAADIIQDVVKKTDFVCRYGGEEIALILPGADEKALQRITGKILKGLVSYTQKLNQKSNDSAKGSVRQDPMMQMSQERDLSASIGGVSMQLPNKIGKDRETFVRRADTLLYMAKEGTQNKQNQGRNQAVIASLDENGNIGKTAVVTGPSIARVP